ncbi:NIPSNAP family protein [Amycolatopsis pigmentata]|uniref:NIPSNAP family protein n=1 Tax=Amycolatopsis pigmentata TaxID=450801 RepID=A0ABW5FL38_9PSEU
MILERRAYTLRPGAAEWFWDLQREFAGTSAMRRLLSHTVSYFETVAGAAEQIVHLHRFESLADWEDTYAELYRDHPADYFAQARQLLTAQENAFFKAAPGEPSAFTAGAWPVAQLDSELLVVEERRDLLPGRAPRYWEAVGVRSDSLGSFLSFSGQFHRVLTYTAVSGAPSPTEPGSGEVLGAVAPITYSAATTLLRPAPVATHRPAFEPHGA